MAKKLGIGVIGCGNISKAYFSLAPLFRGIEMRACADINMEAAKARAKEFKLRAETVEDLLKADDIDIIVNLTIPAVHYEVSKQILDAGKHVYSEKPFVLSVKEGLRTSRRGRRRKGLRIGSAPDTFLGGAHQLVRDLIDTGKLGKITSGTCHVMSHGMEHWHPNPDFFFQPGAGPVLDIGPYYITNLIQLIGPVKQVAAFATTPAKERTISSKPRAGEKIPVDDADDHPWPAGVREWCRGHAQHQLGRLGPWPRADGALWRDGHGVRAGSEFLRRRRALHARQQAGQEAAEMEAPVRCPQ
jgi:predicted dehydrogenase